MPSEPLAYHITFGTYGTRLHGDDQLTVDRRHNEYGTPFLERDRPRNRHEEKLLRVTPVTLTLTQRQFLQQEMPTICQRGNWTLHAVACAPDHIHVVLSADAHGNQVRRWLKTWCSQSLSQQWPLAEGQRWWAVGGSVKWIWKEDYLQTAIAYVANQSAPMPVSQSRGPRDDQSRGL